MTTATPEPEPEPAGGISGGVALFLAVAWFVGDYYAPDTGLVAATLTGAAILTIPAVLFAALLLAAGARRPRRYHRRSRH